MSIINKNHMDIGKWSVIFFADFSFVCPTELVDLSENSSKTLHIKHGLIVLKLNKYINKNPDDVCPAKTLKPNIDLVGKV